MKHLALACAMLLAAVCLSFAPHPVRADGAPQFDILERADGARIVPERFLRSWDPVTLFFRSDAGPQGGGPEDAPAQFVKMTPDIPGAWQWLGPRALQFRPSAAWRPLEPVVFEAEGAATRLIPLLPEPITTSPAAESEPIAELDHVVMTFAGPVDLAALSRLTSIELRPAPGLAGGDGQFLTAQDFTILPLEGAKKDAGRSYLVRLKNAVPDGRVVILRLKLSNEPGLDEPSFALRLQSATPFAVTGASCGEGLESASRDRLLHCAPAGGEDEPRVRSLSLGFSATPEPLDIAKARDALRISPPVERLAVEPDGARLKISGKFLADTIYELILAPGSLSDDRKRQLAGAPFLQRFAFAPARASLAFDVRQGIVERFGPQLIPMRGAGFDKVDLRIYAIDPLSRDFWPFPAEGVDTDDSKEPPLPGNAPERWSKDEDADGGAIAQRIKALGSPAVSELAALPIGRQGAGGKFGLDLKPFFDRIKGAGEAGAYLVGMRPIGADTRSFMRVQVTDLTLTTVEETGRVRFVVTSLSTAKPVEGAEVKLEGLREDKYETLVAGRTDAEGAFTWGVGEPAKATIKRITVAKGLDVLALDPAHGPAEYAGENWTKPDEAWLAWTVDPQTDRAEAPRTLCHLFTERPIYRPEEPVQIKGYVRRYLGGALSYAKGTGTLLVKGPGGQEWRLPATIDETGNVYRKFDAATPATGDYSVAFEPDREVAEGALDEGAEQPDENATQAENEGPVSCGETPFKKEAYRLPTFEVLLNAPQTAALDGAFSVELLARYFAGGLVADRPIKWRASQFPYAWTPPGREGWFFSTDARFSGDGKFKSTPVLEREGTTDSAGAAKITFDPSIEPTAQPRRYQIEATVAGDDQSEVRNIVSVAALPPFVLGVKTPRYQKQPGPIDAEILAVDAKGAPIEGVAMTARLVRRNWSSTLQASDFSQGAAKYVTEIVDETVSEKQITSGKEAQKLGFEARAAGVYLVELEASDRSGRRQKIAVDFFVGGDSPATFARAPSQTAEVAADKEAYAPGETASLIIQSPFQNARALAIVEDPGGRFRYEWVNITNGFGRFEVAVATPDLPRLAVHFLIMRGRLPDGGADASAPFDQGKPVTIAATKWITVTPVKNIVTVALDYPQKARPGQEIEIALKLSDDLGKPVAGEATFWMVDQAVLSLAKERPLDPLPNFIVDRPTTMAARDTRNMAFGLIPLDEAPGGDAGLDEWGSDNNVSVRKNFTPVPIYLPKVIVGPSGMVKIKVKLPDSLTIFKLRAKAISGPERFGFATGEMLIRQDLVAQPALPRFLRNGDAFSAAFLGRVVEGPAGSGRASLSVDGLTLQGSGERNFTFEPNHPARLDFPVVVPPSGGSARLRFTLKRDADQARDAVEIELPIRPDRPVTRERKMLDIAAGGALTLPAIAAKLRPGSLRRSLDVASDPAIVRLVAGLNYLVEYPYGCTEQRISLASAALALKPFEAVLAASDLGDRLKNDVHNTIIAISQSVDADGLVAFWPRARGSVSLTAWAYGFLVAAQRAGEPVDKALSERLAAVLKQSLRSDYSRLRTGEELRERVEALTALADGGRLDQAYAAELSRRAAAMPNVSVALMTQVAMQLPGDGKQIAGVLLEDMWTRVKFLNRNGKEVYAGQAADDGDPEVLPSETRGLAEMTRAAALVAPQDPRSNVLRDGLLRLGAGDGWGDTNANSAAMRALASIWRKTSAQTDVSVTQDGKTEQASLSAGVPLARLGVNGAGEVRIANAGAAPIVALSNVSYLQAEPGYLAQASAQGFVVSRKTYKITEGAPPLLLEPGPDGALHLQSGDVIEEAVEVVSPQDRTHVAITIPLAAGFDPLNPNLATAPREASPSFAPTLLPTWTAFDDDQVFYAYDFLPKGNYRFAFRAKAMIEGSFTQPPGETETMYQAGVHGSSAGRRIIIAR
ncbi:alpha-2-macroglobulin family protein [Methylocella silvestris]|uniref:Alpha-2-macroglobulin n=1 Tax=Methylocella silvestris TaxID=199596 RepID=A0A2J7TK94_METSI|nr:alpha-2-macroglobulin family protein [Methylocella silvestris]PNG27192.1 alpha-2-macroglobulin [Methylocella silvestris]